jgi:Holliday junction resolvasome RuvABC ATP-dependent DNA helicase subunit
MTVEEAEEMCRRSAGTPRMSTSAQELMYLVKRFFEVQKSETADRIV